MLKGQRLLGLALGMSLFATATGQTVTYEYDELGRVRSAVYADGTVLEYEYDAAGNRIFYNVTDVNATGTVQFSAPTYVVSESGPSIVVTVTRINGSSGAASVNFATTNGTAIAGSDYTAQSGALNWTHADESNKTISIPIIDDVVYEPTEAFTVTLSGATGAALGTPGATTITILENDNPPGGTVQFAAANYTVAENGTSIAITVSRVNGSTGAASVNYATSNGTATAGSDYTGASGTLTWASGNTANKTFSVPITNDTALESNETVILTLSGATGAIMGSPSTATLTITDNDGPGTLQFSNSNYNVDESGGSRTVTVTRTNGAVGAASVNYATSNGTATAGSDYTAKTGTLSWANGDSVQKTFSVTITNDTAPESTETLNLTLSGATGAALGSPTAATISIADNDPTGTLQFSSATYAVAESGPTITITVTRANGSAGPASVNYSTSDGTAIGDSDYTPRFGTLTWGSGNATSKTIAVGITNDTAVEGSETFTMTLSSASGATMGSPSVTTVTITDND